ncbi:hypothetical protein [Anaerobaca lacustris]|uniref:Sigma-70 family RNA polymerase sigma factor n=1 Tax=Anaerobaca lacustris TaxID=3044600 RepID=A0AAW6U3Z1_9BACT|nr:hypothetical protein [Sedimentisphaerales bacterium M17dextr]
MKDNTTWIEDGIEVAESSVLTREKPDRYGTVPGLDIEELADPQELELQVFREQYGPILALPRPRGQDRFFPEIDPTDGTVCGAFGTIDFARISVPFDKARYKADKLREKLKDATIMLSIVMERVPNRAKYLVLKYLRMGFLDVDDIVSEDMRAIAKWYLRVRAIRQEIGELVEAGKQRERQKLLSLP